MFTGIVEEIGVIKNITKGVNSEKLLIQCNKVLEETKLGDSICTNGVCLTVTDINDHSFQADVMAETLLRSNLGNLTLGSEVNLERALTLSSRLGGHIVSGHIDGVGKIVSLKRIDNSIEVTIEAKLSILKYIIEKGYKYEDGIEGNIKNLLLAMETGNIDRLLTAVDEAMERADARNPEAKKVMKTDIK